MRFFFSLLVACYSRYLFRDPEDKTAKMRRAVRANNFTQQTNALDVDKHMYALLPLLFFLRKRGPTYSHVGWRTLRKT